MTAKEAVLLLNIGASYTFAYADEKPDLSCFSGKIGHEADVTVK